MARHFPCWLTAYNSYSKDGFVPDRFHEWVGLSLLAGVVERKITLKQDLIHYVPNIYVMLVSHPKQGKSTAVDRGADLLEQMRKDYLPNFRIIPTRTTDSAFIDLMKICEHIHIPGTSSELKQSAGYFYAGEASASALQNLYGDFVASLTAFYDCPRWYRDKTKGNPIMTEIENGCMNLLAGTTFNFLKRLVNDDTVDGGFASRLIYVVSPDRKVREGKWESNNSTLDGELREKLIQDLVHINKLIGPMKPTEAWKKRYEEWQPEFDKYLIKLNSPSLESIIARKDMNLIKVSMLLSLSESDALVMTEAHFDKALSMIDEVYKDVPMVLSMATIADKQSQKGITQFVGQVLKKNGGELPRETLHSIILAHGNDLDKFAKSYDSMFGAKWLTYDASTGMVKLLIEPNDYL